MTLIVPNDRNERWRLLEALINEWFEPLRSTDGYSATELAPYQESMPLALREFYALAGRRRDIWSRNDFLLAPSELQLEGDIECVYIENQAVAKWGIHRDHLAHVDPPVFEVDTGAGFLDEEKFCLANSSISEFALQLLLYNTTCSKRLWGSMAVFGTATALETIYSRYERVALTIWRFPQREFYEAPGAMIQVEIDTDWVLISARTEESYVALARMLTESGVDWNTGSRTESF
jgi:hypothetical protein